jgi:hypothetical protein
MNMLVSAASISTVPAVALAAEDDRQLLDLEERILEAHEAAMAYDEDITRCHMAWHDEFKRLELEALLGRCKLTADERWQLVRQMPEAAEQSRLAGLQQPHFDRMDQLIKQMWAIPAKTSEGHCAKVWVLLNCTMRSEWLDSDQDADWDIEQARKLLIEFVGGQPGEELRKQFATNADRNEPAG